MYTLMKSAAVAATLVATPAIVSAAVVTAGPGGFDNGFATTITFEDDNVVARRGVANGRDNALNALGAADGGFFELGFGSTADFTFGTLFNGDVTAFEVTFGTPGAFPEIVEVSVGLGAAPFTTIGTLTNSDASGANGGSLTITGGGLFDTVRLTDMSPVTSTFENDVNGNPVGGFDINAVRVSAVPVPAAGLLLLGALGGFAGLRRRRKA